MNLENTNENPVVEEQNEKKFRFSPLAKKIVVVGAIAVGVIVGTALVLGSLSDSEEGEADSDDSSSDDISNDTPMVLEA